MLHILLLCCRPFVLHTLYSVHFLYMTSQSVYLVVTCYTLCCFRLFVYMCTHTEYRAELLCLWNILEASGHDAAHTYTHMLTLTAHQNDVPQITVNEHTDQVSQI